MSVRLPTVGGVVTPFVALLTSGRPPVPGEWYDYVVTERSNTLPARFATSYDVIDAYGAIVAAVRRLPDPPGSTGFLRVLRHQIGVFAGGELRIHCEQLGRGQTRLMTGGAGEFGPGAVVMPMTLRMTVTAPHPGGAPIEIGRMRVARRRLDEPVTITAGDGRVVVRIQRPHRSWRMPRPRVGDRIRVELCDGSPTWPGPLLVTAVPAMEHLIDVFSASIDS